MIDRPSNALAFFTLLAVCLAGLLHVSWWASLLGACVLILVSLNNHWRAPAFRRSADAVPDSVQLASSAFNAISVSVAAFAFGYGTGIIWGV